MQPGQAVGGLRPTRRVGADVGGLGGRGIWGVVFWANCPELKRCDSVD